MVVGTQPQGMQPAPDLGADFSLASVLSPAPVSAIGTVLEMIRAVPELTLCTPMLQEALRQKHAVECSDAQVKNILWKMKEYLPFLLPSQGYVGRLDATVKMAQAFLQDNTTVAIPPSRTVCPNGCGELGLCVPVDRARISCNIKGRSHVTKVDSRFCLYSLAAGVQRASFQEAYCRQCKKHYLGCWSYARFGERSQQNNYSKRDGIRYLHSDLDDAIMIIPKEKAVYAVEVALLRDITDRLAFGGATFEATLLAWMRQHREPWQVSLLMGADLTLRNSTTQRVMAAWFAWTGITVAEGRCTDMTWSFARRDFDNTLVCLQSAIEQARLDRAHKHCETCPRCSNYFLVIADGKWGAKRHICAGLEGEWRIQQLGVSMHTGCLRQAAPAQLHCPCCRPSRLQQSALIPQVKVLDVQIEEDTRALRYRVVCKESADPAAPSFDAWLPRREVRKDVLATFEASLLPGHGEHRSKKVARVKVSSVRRLGVQRSIRKGAAGSKADVEPERGRQTARGRGRAAAATSRGRGVAAAAVSQRKQRRQGSKRPVATPEVVAAGALGWVASTPEEEEEVSACGVDKNMVPMARRRCTGGIVTAVASCGHLLDWKEMPYGESVDFVYVFLLLLFMGLCQRGRTIAMIAYDNACKLRSKIASKAASFAPWTSAFAETKVVLDAFHRDNHTWCLERYPDIDPNHESNAKALRGKNTQACEQLNAWISNHTASSLAMGRGHFLVYWEGMFCVHNAWLEEVAAARLRRYQAGFSSTDPTVARPKRGVAEPSAPH